MRLDLTDWILTVTAIGYRITIDATPRHVRPPNTRIDVACELTPVGLFLHEIVWEELTHAPEEKTDHHQAPSDDNA